jgi:ABC-2 type transport system permease protein
MFAILKKEINSFFASPIGYLVIALFLLLNGMFLWLFKGDSNILDYGFADVSSFFFLSPWFLILLITSVTNSTFYVSTLDFNFLDSCGYHAQFF